MSQIKLSHIVKEQQFKRFVRESFTNAHYRLVAEAYGQLTEADGPINKSQIEDLLLQTIKDLKSKGVVDEVPKDVDLDAMEKDDHENAIEENKQRLSEGATALLAIPGVMSLIGRAINWIYRKRKFSDSELAEYKKRKKQYLKLKRDPRVTDDALHHFEEKYLKGTNVGDWFKHVGHNLHGWLSTPLRFLIAGLIWMYPPNNKTLSWKQAMNKARQSTDIISALLIGGIAGYGVVSSWMHAEGIKASSTVMQALEGLDIAENASAAIDAVRAIDIAELGLELGEDLV